MTEISITELMDEPAEGATEAAETVAEETAKEGTGEWLGKVIERLDQKGLLEPILFGQEGAQELREQQETNVDPGGDGEGAGADLDAETIAEFGKKIIDSMGDVQISQIVVYAEENPEEVNKMLDQHLGGD